MISFGFLHTAVDVNFEARFCRWTTSNVIILHVNGFGCIDRRRQHRIAAIEIKKLLLKKPGTIEMREMILTTKQPVYNRRLFLPLMHCSAYAISVQSFQLIRFDTHCWCDFQRLIEQMAHLCFKFPHAHPYALHHHHSWNLRIGYCNALSIRLHSHDSLSWKTHKTIDCTKHTKSDRILSEQSEIVIDHVCMIHRCTYLSVGLSVCLLAHHWCLRF